MILGDALNLDSKILLQDCTLLSISMSRSIHGFFWLFGWCGGGFFGGGEGGVGCVITSMYVRKFGHRISEPIHVSHLTFRRELWLLKKWTLTV